MKYNLVLIFDEIQSGLGRTGKMWAGQHWDVEPDIMCLAKGIAGGVPMGLTVMRSEIFDCLKLENIHLHLLEILLPVQQVLQQ